MHRGRVVRYIVWVIQSLQAAPGCIGTGNVSIESGHRNCARGASHDQLLKQVEFCTDGN